LGTEIDLIKESCLGNRKSQESLYIKYKTKWFMICLRYSFDKSQAEDMLQDSLVNIFTNIKQFNPTKGNFSQWSSKIVVNSCLLCLKKWKKLTFDDYQQSFYDKIDEVNSIYDTLGEQELMKIVQSLPTGYRVVFNMYAIEGYKHGEIAEILGISIGTSKSQLAKAKKILRSKVELLFQTDVANER